MDDDKKKPTDDYKVGYGKPPKHTQFKAAPAEQGPGGKSAKSGRERTHNKRGKVDVSAVLNEWVPVTKDRTASKMAPFEVALRAQVKKALTERNLAAIRIIVALAIEYGLIVPPPEAQANGGVLIIPKTFSELEQRAIFDTLEPSMSLINEALKISHAKKR
jgi:hypothetical protein